jgi:hypothetical protein
MALLPGSWDATGSVGYCDSQDGERMASHDKANILKIPLLATFASYMPAPPKLRSTVFTPTIRGLDVCEPVTTSQATGVSREAGYSKITTLMKAEGVPG